MPGEVHVHKGWINLLCILVLALRIMQFCSACSAEGGSHMARDIHLWPYKIALQISEFCHLLALRKVDILAEVQTCMTL